MSLSESEVGPPSSLADPGIDTWSVCCTSCGKSLVPLQAMWVPIDRRSQEPASGEAMFHFSARGMGVQCDP